MKRSPTYTAEQLAEASAAWSDYGPEWRPWRRLARTSVGIIYPPSGSGWDSWEDANPSQRAVLVWAIRYAPLTLRAAITSAPEPSWAPVVAAVLRAKAGWEAAARYREARAAARKREQLAEAARHRASRNTSWERAL